MTTSFCILVLISIIDAQIETIYQQPFTNNADDWLLTATASLTNDVLCPSADKCMVFAKDAKVVKYISTVGYHTINAEWRMRSQMLDALHDGSKFKLWYNYNVGQQNDINLNAVDWKQWTITGKYASDLEVTSYSVALDQADNDAIVGLLFYLPPSSNQAACYLNDFEITGIKITQPPTSLTSNPTLNPTMNPTTITSNPTLRPTTSPTKYPTTNPTEIPTKMTTNPTLHPTKLTHSPSQRPTHDPSQSPTNHPSAHPSQRPTHDPTISPSNRPTGDPSFSPSKPPTDDPSKSPSQKPTNHPNMSPSPSPTLPPTKVPIKMVSDPTWSSLNTQTNSEDSNDKSRDDVQQTGSVISMTTLVYIVVIGAPICICGAICALLRVLYIHSSNNEESDNKLGKQERSTVKLTLVASHNIIDEGQSLAISADVTNGYYDKAFVNEWVEGTLKMPMYIDNFVMNGYDTIKSIKSIRHKKQLTEIGIIPSHQMLIMKAIDRLHDIETHNVVAIDDNGDNDNDSDDDVVIGMQVTQGGDYVPRPPKPPSRHIKQRINVMQTTKRGEAVAVQSLDDDDLLVNDMTVGVGDAYVTKGGNPLY